MKNPTEELLIRWYQLGAWLPFFRGHSNRNVPRREPYLYCPETQSKIHQALQERYQHLPYWYTLFWQHSTTGEPVIRPLVYEYPNQSEFSQVDDKFLIGKDVLVCPILYTAQIELEIKFPGKENDIWYRFKSERVESYQSFTKHYTFTDLDTLPVFYRGGAVIPIKLNVEKSTILMRDSRLTLYIFLDTSGCAVGSVYNDDRETFTYEEKNYSYVEFEYKDNTIFNRVINPSWDGGFQQNVINTIYIFGSDCEYKNASIATEKVSNSSLEVVMVNKVVKIVSINVQIEDQFLIKLSK